MGRFLITGAAGFIGSHTVTEAVVRGHSVIAIDAFTSYYSPELKVRNARIIKEAVGVTVADFDLGEGRIEELLDGVDGVLHLAGQPGVRQSWSDFDTYVRQNITCTNRLLRACLQRGVPRIVLASSSSVYGNAARFPVRETDPVIPFSPYGVTKLASEHLVRAYSENFGVQSVCLRYFTVYGPRQRPDMAFSQIAQSMINGSAFTLFGDGSQIRDFTYVGDVVEANIAALISPLQESVVLNISGGSSASMSEVLEIFDQIAPGRLRLNKVEAVEGDVFRTGGSNQSAFDQIGWVPRMGLRAGIEKQFADSLSMG